MKKIKKIERKINFLILFLFIFFVIQLLDFFLFYFCPLTTIKFFYNKI